MATCKENCSHYSVCGIWDRKVFVNYDNNILSDFSDFPNVEEYCRNYFPKQIEAEWIPVEKLVPDWGANIIHHYECSNCQTLEYTNDHKYCSNCGAKMTGKEIK